MTHDIPEAVKQHLKGMAIRASRQDDEKFMKTLIGVWKQKTNFFEYLAGDFQLELSAPHIGGDFRGAAVLTYSGSLLCIGPVDPDRTGGGNGRWVEYTSIHLRTDVPDIVTERNAVLEGDISAGAPVVFSNSQLKKTSPVFLAASCPANWDVMEQERIIREISIHLTTGFLKHNRNIMEGSSNIPDQFTSKSMIRYIAKRHSLTAVEAGKIIDDYVTLIETGMLLGETVPLGKIGRLGTKVKAASKPRTIRHPQTGEAVQVEGKPAALVPKISFSGQIKDKFIRAGAQGLDSEEEELGPNEPG